MLPVGILAMTSIIHLLQCTENFSAISERLSDSPPPTSRQQVSIQTQYNADGSTLPHDTIIHIKAEQEPAIDLNKQHTVRKPVAKPRLFLSANRRWAPLYKKPQRLPQTCDSYNTQSVPNNTSISVNNSARRATSPVRTQSEITSAYASSYSEHEMSSEYSRNCTETTLFTTQEQVLSHISRINTQICMNTAEASKKDQQIVNMAEKLIGWITNTSGRQNMSLEEFITHICLTDTSLMTAMNGRYSAVVQLTCERDSLRSSVATWRKQLVSFRGPPRSKIQTSLLQVQQVYFSTNLDDLANYSRDFMLVGVDMVQRYLTLEQRSILYLNSLCSMKPLDKYNMYISLCATTSLASIWKTGADTSRIFRHSGNLQKTHCTCALRQYSTYQCCATLISDLICSKYFTQTISSMSRIFDILYFSNAHVYYQAVRCVLWYFMQTHKQVMNTQRLSIDAACCNALQITLQMETDYCTCLSYILSVLRFHVPHRDDFRSAFDQNMLLLNTLLQLDRDCAKDGNGEPTFITSILRSPTPVHMMFAISNKLNTHILPESILYRDDCIQNAIRHFNKFLLQMCKHDLLVYFIPPSIVTLWIFDNFIFAVEPLLGRYRKEIFDVFSYSPENGNHVFMETVHHTFKDLLAIALHHVRCKMYMT